MYFLFIPARVAMITFCMRLPIRILAQGCIQVELPLWYRPQIVAIRPNVGPCGYLDRLKLSFRIRIGHAVHFSRHNIACYSPSADVVKTLSFKGKLNKSFATNDLAKFFLGLSIGDGRHIDVQSATDLVDRVVDSIVDLIQFDLCLSVGEQYLSVTKKYQVNAAVIWCSQILDVDILFDIEPCWRHKES